MAANRMRSIRRETRPLSQLVRPRRKAARIVGQRRLEIGDRRRAGVERLERVDQDDLPVEAGEMIAEERPHHGGLIGLVAPRHHRGERARAASRRRARSSGEKVRAGEPSRSPGIRKRPGGSVERLVPVGADGAEVVGEERGKLARQRLVFRRRRVDARRAAPASRAASSRRPRRRGPRPRASRDQVA